MHLVHSAAPVARRDRFIRLPEVEKTVALKKSAIYDLMAKGEFPHSVRTSPRCVAWSEQAVLQWMEDRKAAAAAEREQPPQEAAQ